MALRAAPTVETVRGPARTAELSGGSYAAVFGFGAVVAHAADGRVLWSRDTGSLYRDWHVQWLTKSYLVTPQLAWGTNPVDPLQFAGPARNAVSDVSPFAVGDLTGDGVADIATADIVGVNTSPEVNCGGAHCKWPFDIPGSDLHLGTFVTVLDGRTGRMVYSELEPGYVTQLTADRGRLLIGDETGDPQNDGGIGQWGSTTTVHDLRLTRHGASFTATRDWTFSTHSPWARLFGVVAAGSDQVGLAWSDTPLELGEPGPPDGHVVLLDERTGKVRHDIRTAGYPVLLAADRSRGELVSVQVSDVTQHVGYAVTGVRVRDGLVGRTVRRSGALPMSLAVGAGPARSGHDWLVGAMDAKVSVGAQILYEPTAGRVSSVVPDAGTERWSTKLPDNGPLEPAQPGGLVAADGAVYAGSWLGAETPTGSIQRDQTDEVAAMDAANGRLRWHVTGDPGDPLSLSAARNGDVRAVSDNQVLRTYDRRSGVVHATAAEQGDVLSTTTVRTDHGADVVAGDESGAVSSYPGAGLTPTATGWPQPRWQAVLPGSVHDLQSAIVDGHSVVVAAASNSVGIVDATTGRVRSLIHVAAGYVWTTTIGTVGVQPAVFVPAGQVLDAYSLRTGKLLWRHSAPGGASFSNVAVSDGVVLAEYSSPDTAGNPAAHMAAIGLNSATGSLRWSVASDPASTLRGQLWNGVAAGPDIPGASGHGAAFAWSTPRGSARIDVRDARTGALAYADSDDSLNNHTGYAMDPSLGLVAESQAGLARITPTGALVSTAPSGLSTAIVHTGGQALVLAASVEVDAYASTIFTDPGEPAVAGDGTFNAGSVRTVDLGKGDEALATPVDWLAFRVVNGESGFTVGAYWEGLPHGMSVLSLTTGTAANGRRSAAATHADRAPTGGVQRVPTVDPEPSRLGTTVPYAEVRPSTAGPAAAPLTPALVRSSLGLTGDGRGQTVAIVDAFADPTLVADAEHFSTQLGLPGVCGAGGTAGNCFTLDVAGGSTSTDPGWALETALDVEWTHAVAPKARIMLVTAKDATFVNQFRAVDTAVAAHPAAVSMSWGIGREFSDETYYDWHCAATRTVCVIATGDRGHPGSYPAENPAAIAVGGTTLDLDTDGSVAQEQAWSDSGGGRSWVEPESPAQRTVVAGGAREIPDVSFDADPQTGVAVYDSQPIGTDKGWFQVGGTSLGAPVWSAILADTDQVRASAGHGPLTAQGYAAQRAIYGLPAGALGDITSGPPNGFCPTGCTAGPGFDMVTGLGSPRSGIDLRLAQGAN